MAIRQLKWELVEGGMIGTTVNDDHKLVVMYEDILDYEVITNPISFHYFQHGIKQTLGDTFNTTVKDGTLAEKFESMVAKWNDIMVGKLSTRKAKAPKFTRKQVMEILLAKCENDGREPTEDELNMITLLYG